MDEEEEMVAPLRKTEGEGCADAECAEEEGGGGESERGGGMDFVEDAERGRRRKRRSPTCYFRRLHLLSRRAIPQPPQPGPKVTLARSDPPVLRFHSPFDIHLSLFIVIYYSQISEYRYCCSYISRSL